MFNIVLVEPEIPQNTGNVVRTCAATGCRLHLVRPLGFEVSDKYLKRAGLDYWHYVEIVYYDSLSDFLDKTKGARLFFFSSKARRAHSEAQYREGDFLVFGKETAGLPEELLLAHAEDCVRIPMRAGVRCLNLSNSVAVAVYEALRQQDYAGLTAAGGTAPPALGVSFFTVLSDFAFKFLSIALAKGNFFLPPPKFLPFSQPECLDSVFSFCYNVSI